MEEFAKERNLAAGKVLTKLRLERKLSKKELGKLLSCTSQAISQFEINGIGRNDTIVKICRVLDVEPLEFFGEIESLTEKQRFKKVDVVSPELIKTFIKCPYCEKKIIVQVFVAPFVEY